MTISEVLINLSIGLVGALIGAAISFFVTRHYARKGTEQLDGEASRIRRLLNTVLLGLEQQGVPIGRDEKGEPTGGVEFEAVFDTLRRVRNSKAPQPGAVAADERGEEGQEVRAKPGDQEPPSRTP